jgi:hypothetical protein
MSLSTEVLLTHPSCFDNKRFPWVHPFERKEKKNLL